MQWNIFYFDMVLLQMLNMCNIEEVQNKSFFFFTFWMFLARIFTFALFILNQSLSELIISHINRTFAHTDVNTKHVLYTAASVLFGS